MAHEIKLDVFTLQLIDKGSKAFLDFDNFYTEPNKAGKEVEKSFSDLFIEYVKSFDGKFVKHIKSGKAIGMAANGARFYSEQRIIKGQIQGGTTGVGSKIKKVDNVGDEDAFQVGVDDVNSIPHYFMIWIPEDSNMGLIIVQSLGNKTISEIFKEHFRRFIKTSFNDKITPVLNELIPKEALEKTKNGTIDTVIFRRLHLPSDKAEKILGLKYTGEDLKVEIKISGLGKINGTRNKIMDVMTGKTPALFDTSSLVDYGIDGNHDTIVKFEHNGKVTQGKRSNEFRLSPSYYVDENDIQRDVHKHPTFKSMDTYCTSFLTALKTEIKYVPVKKDKK